MRVRGALTCRGQTRFDHSAQLHAVGPAERHRHHRTDQPRHRPADRASRGERSRRRRRGGAPYPSRLAAVQDLLPRSGDGAAGGRSARAAAAAVRDLDRSAAGRSAARSTEQLDRRRHGAAQRPLRSDADGAPLVLRRLQAVARQHHLGIQPAVLAAAGRRGRRTPHRGFEAALPSGGSDANHPRRSPIRWPTSGRCCAISQTRDQLPPEVYAMEIGVGSGARARLWLDQVQGARRRVRHGLLLAAAVPARRLLAGHARHRARPRSDRTPDLQRASRSTRTNPFKTLSFLRFKILFIHLTNVYDNLSFDEIARRDGQLYHRRGPARTSAAAAAAGIAADFGLTAEQLPDDDRSGCSNPAPKRSATSSAAMVFWNCVWSGAAPRGAAARARRRRRRRTCRRASAARRSTTCSPRRRQDVRFHLSRGAAESFVNTVPLLHPRGYLQVQDIFVSAMKDYSYGLPRPRQARWLVRHLGQRRVPPRRRRPRRLRRALRAVQVPQGIEDADPLHHSARLITMTLPLLPTTVIGSYSMPPWLERAKNDYLQRKVSRHDLEDMYDAARKAAIKDQEVAGVDIVSDGELQRDNMIDYFAERLPGVQVDQGSKRLLLRLLRERRPLEAGHRLARPRRRSPLPQALHRAPGQGLDLGTARAGQADPQRALPSRRRRSRSIWPGC